MKSNPDKREADLLKDLEKQSLGPLTVDDFLGGKVRLIQLKEGYRAGMDAVLLAASIPALEGERVLDIGAGTGSVAICLARRCQGVTVDGLEIQDSLVLLAEKNIALNGLAGKVAIHQGSVVGDPESIPENFYHHVFANPPYLEGGQAIAPPAKSKGIAYVEGEAALEDWVKFALSKVKNKGTLTFIFRADRMHEICRHLYGRAGELVIFPLWPRVGQPAKRVIIRARKGLHGGTTIAPGLVLHGTEERYSAGAEAVLREAKMIDLAQYHRAKKA